MSNIFQSVVSSKKRYNNFALGREVLTSGQIGKLIPIQCDEVVPGDRFKMSAAFLCRFSPLSAPAMARFNVHFHSFYVPYRIITPETSRESTYEKFIKSIGKPTDQVPILPYIYSSQSANFQNRFLVGTLADYLGYPTGLTSMPQSDRITAMPFLAYQRIYQDFYRRDQIEAEVVYPSNLAGLSCSNGDTSLLSTDANYDVEENQVKATFGDLFKLQTRNYERDYFTSALPEPQFGDEVAIGDGNINWVNSGTLQLPAVGLSGTAEITTPITWGTHTQTNAIWKKASDGTGELGNGINSSTEMGVAYTARMNISSSNGNLLASSLQGNSITINEFRLAMQLQGIKEKINRVGTRYLEIMQGIYDVRVPDARLQRPVYLGGFKNPVTIGSVMQTSETGTTPQGTLTGQMSASGSNNLCNGGYMFLEHGYLITIMSITPRTSYYGGMPRKYMKKYPEEFYLPPFDHLGEQAILKGELKYTSTSVDREEFGYSPHYAEYKSALSTVHGEFRTTLDNWHVSRDFDTSPSLNPSFIKAEPEDFDRIFAFTNVPGTSNEHFQMQIYIDVVAKRNMSKYSTPYTLY